MKLGARFSGLGGKTLLKLRKLTSKDVQLEEVSSPTLPKRTFTDIYGRGIEKGDEYFYPKQLVGIPVFSVESVYEHYSPIITEILNKSGIGSHRKFENGVNVLDALYRNVIKRYIEYAHMLPASEYHHHSTTGGLIAHSLQASLYSLRYGREKKPETTRFQDIDKAVEPVYRYAAWLGGLLHDAGKITRDTIVDAVEVLEDGANRRLKEGESIPTWRPQKESLIAWASRFGVATYTITWRPGRIHNQHNIDSALFLPEVIGRDEALDYLTENPVNIYDKLGDALSRHDTSMDYLSTCIRSADTLSVNKDVSKFADAQMGERTLSKEAMILKTLRVVKSGWEYNRVHGHCWVLGDAVYLRHTKAFDDIVKEARRLEYTLPHDSRIVISIMEECGMLEAYSPDDKLVNFAAGKFTEEDVIAVFDKRLIPKMEPLFKLRWKGTLFGDDPIPDSGIGLFLSPDGSVIERVLEGGKIVVHEKARTKSTNETPKSTDEDKATSSDTETGADGQAVEDKASSSERETDDGEDKQSPALSDKAKDGALPKEKLDAVDDSKVKTSQTKPIVKEVVVEPSDKKTVMTSNDTKGIVFKNQPKVQVNEGVQASGSDTVVQEVDSKSPAKDRDTESTKQKTPPKSEHDVYTKISPISKERLSQTKDKLNGYWIDLDEAISILGCKGKREAVDKLSEGYFLQLNRDKQPQICGVTIDSNAMTLIRLKPPRKKKTKNKHSEQPTDQNRQQAETGKAESDQSSKEAQVGDTKEKDEPVQSQLELGTNIESESDSKKEIDHGLIAALTDVRPNSLAAVISFSQSDNKSDWFGETNAGVEFSISDLAKAVGRSKGKKVYAKTLLGHLAHDDISEFHRDGQTFFVVPYPLLNVIVID